MGAYVNPGNEGFACIRRTGRQTAATLQFLYRTSMRLVAFRFSARVIRYSDEHNIRIIRETDRIIPLADLRDSVLRASPRLQLHDERRRIDAGARTEHQVGKPLPGWHFPLDKMGSASRVVRE